MRTEIQLTPWQAHIEKWRDCTRCELHRVRSQVVFARGKIPCDILFVGEAPGRSEDALGKAFIGPAGELQDEITAEALEGLDLRFAYANLLACLPLDADGELDEPPEESVVACSPRLAELVQIAKPRLLVRVGKHAQDYLTPGFRHSLKLGWGCEMIDVVHPGALLPGRGKSAQQSHLRRHAIATLRNAAEKL